VGRHASGESAAKHLGKLAKAYQSAVRMVAVATPAKHVVETTVVLLATNAVETSAAGEVPHALWLGSV
jgi:hypothetical protein